MTVVDGVCGVKNQEVGRQVPALVGAGRFGNLEVPKGEDRFVCRPYKGLVLALAADGSCKFGEADNSAHISVVRGSIWQ